MHSIMRQTQVNSQCKIVTWASCWSTSLGESDVDMNQANMTRTLFSWDRDSHSQSVHTAVFAFRHLVGAYVAKLGFKAARLSGCFTKVRRHVMGKQQHKETDMDSTRVGLCWRNV